MNKNARNYEKLVQLYGKDRAARQQAETASEIRQRRAGNEQNTIDEIVFMVTQNMVNLENLSENKNVDVHQNEVGDEASPIPTNQQSCFESQSASKSKQVNGVDIIDNMYSLSVAIGC